MKNLLDLAQIEKKEISPLTKYVQSLKGVDVVNGTCEGDVYFNDLSIQGEMLTNNGVKIDSINKKISIGSPATDERLYISQTGSKLLRTDEINLSTNGGHFLDINGHEINSSHKINITYNNVSSISVSNSSTTISPQENNGKINKFYRSTLALGVNQTIDLYSRDFRLFKFIKIFGYISSGADSSKIEKLFNWNEYGSILQSGYEDEAVLIGAFKVKNDIVIRITAKKSLSAAFKIISITNE